MRPPRGEGAHEDVFRRQAVHADAIPEQRAAAAPARRVHRHYRDLGLWELPRQARQFPRSEEHTSELQSPCNLVCRLLLEKKKKKKRKSHKMENDMSMQS